MRLLVTGAGRCGSWWLTKALQSTGVAAEHEKAFSLHRHGEGHWEAEVSWLAAPFTPVKDCHTVVLVRHPLEQIASRAAWGSFETWQPPKWYDPRRKGSWATEWCPEINDGADPVERAAIHWVRWHEMIQGTYEVLRLEDCDVTAVLRLARLVDPDAARPTLPTEPKNRAYRAKPVVSWGDVAHVDGLIGLAGRFGYDITEVPCVT